MFDPGLPWRPARSVALRPEPFGALVYHFENRKLPFLTSTMLDAVVEAQAGHPSAESASPAAPPVSACAEHPLAGFTP